MNIKPLTKTIFSVRVLLWLIYISLLAVLLPHTAWWFSHGQAKGNEGLAWLLAFVFEASIFAFTHNLVERIERSHRLRRRDSEWWIVLQVRRFSEAYVNFNGAGLLVCSLVSALANFTYAVEFAQPFRVYAEYSLSPMVYHITSGAVLPFIGLLFAHILARLHPIEEGLSENELKAKEEIRSAKREIEGLQSQVETLQHELGSIRVKAVDYERLFAENKEERIRAADKLFPGATGAAIASITGTAPSYVSDVRSGSNVNGKH